MSKELRERGFCFPDNENLASDKLWAQARFLEGMYKKFKDVTKQTGSEAKKKPKFFEEMDKICGDKHSIFLRSITDTMGESSVEPDLIEVDESGPSTSTEKEPAKGQKRKNSNFGPAEQMLNEIKLLR